MSQPAALSTSFPAPPSPRALPLIGNLPQISRYGLLGYLQRLWRRHGDTFRVHLGPRPVVVVVHPDSIERVLSTQRLNFVKGPAYDSIRMLTGQGLLTLDGDAWRKRRRLEQPAFHRHSIAKLVGTMTTVVDHGLAQLRRRVPSGVIDAHAELTRLTLAIVGRTLFGQDVGTGTADDSGRAFGEALVLLSERSNAPVKLPLIVPTPSNRRLKKSLAFLDEVTFSIIQKARVSGTGDTPTLLAMLLAARDADTGEALEDVDLRNEVITLFLAGHETTALLLTWGFTLLGATPTSWRRCAPKSSVCSVIACPRWKTSRSSRTCAWSSTKFCDCVHRRTPWRAMPSKHASSGGFACVRARPSFRSPT